MAAMVQLRGFGGPPAPTRNYVGQCGSVLPGCGRWPRHRYGPASYVEDDLRIGRLVIAVDHVAKTELGYYLVCDPMKATTVPVRLFRDWIRSVR